MISNDGNNDYSTEQNWNEFDWEKAFKKSDKFAHTYFKQLAKYGEFPENTDIIEDNLQNAFKNVEEFYESDLILASENSSFSDEFSDEPSDEEIDSEIKKFVTNPLYINLKRTALGWCNILSSLLKEEDKETGLKILYYLGRALATTICTLSEDAGKAGNTAFIKRTLFYINACGGLLNKLIESRPELAELLSEISKQFSTIHDLTVDYLLQTRSGDNTEEFEEDDEDDDEDEY